MREHTPWQIFLWSVGIFTAICSVIFWRVEVVREDLTQAKTDIAVVKSDTGWIKQILEEKRAISKK